MNRQKLNRPDCRQQSAAVYSLGSSDATERPKRAPRKTRAPRPKPAALPDAIKQTPALNPDTPFTFRALGTPATQGSTKGFIYTNKETGRDQVAITSDNKKLKPWRAAVKKAAQDRKKQLGIDGLVFDCPAFAIVTVILPRLAKHPKTTRGAEPDPPTGKNDTDKHERAIGDALTDAGVLSDDGIIVTWLATKRYARLGETPGALVCVLPNKLLGDYLALNMEGFL